MNPTLRAFASGFALLAFGFTGGFVAGARRAPAVPPRVEVEAAAPAVNPSAERPAEAATPRNEDAPDRAELAALRARVAELERDAGVSLRSKIENLRQRIPDLAAAKDVVGLLNLATELAQLGKEAWPAAMEALRAGFDDALAEARSKAGISFLGMSGFSAEFMLSALMQEKVPRELNGHFGSSLLFSKQLDSKRILQAILESPNSDIVPFLVGALNTRHDGKATVEQAREAMRRHSASPQAVDALLQVMGRAEGGLDAVAALSRDPDPGLAESARIHLLSLDPPCAGMLVNALHASVPSTALRRGDIVSDWDGAPLRDSRTWFQKSKELKEGNGWATLTVLRQGATQAVRVTSSDLAAIASSSFLQEGVGPRESFSEAPPAETR